MADNKHISIPKKVETKDDLDFDFLRREGVKHIEQLGSKLWTDYNSHDPGITTLEVLSYAITDLGMRMNLDMQDILTSEDKKTAHEQFIKAINILPSAPLTHLDYRKLFIDIGESINLNRPIKNCWLVPYTEIIYTDCRTGDLAFDRIKLGAKTSSFNVKGLYKLLVDTDEKLDTCDLANIQSEILRRYHDNRNLCEDLVTIEEVGNQDVAVCARIEVERNVDEEYIHAQVLHTIEQYFAPEVHFYSLEQLLDKGYTTDQIFEGPLLDCGFIDTEELRNSQLKTEIRLSDIVREIMQIDGVKQIKEISMNRCGDTSSEADPWVLCLDPGKKPVLCDSHAFSYSKGTLPLNINQTKVEKYLQEIKEEEALERENIKSNMELTFPEGSYYQIDKYETILNEFPDTYGVGSFGIVSKATPEREALAKQLKSYLLFFDKILASYFKHLGKVKEVLSVNGSLQQTYFTQALKDVSGLNELLGGKYINNDDVLSKLLFEDIDNNIQRRNQVLDHLIGRFAERFGEYTFIMKELYGNSVDEIVLRSKESFLKDYTEISRSRGLGYTYWETPKERLWDTDNVSGVQKRIARLLGIKDYTRRNISNSPVKINVIDNNDDERYTWKIIDDNGREWLYSNIEYQIEFVAFTTMQTAVFNTIQIDSEDVENIFEKPISDGQFMGNIRLSKVSAEEYNFIIVNNLDDQKEIAFNKPAFKTQEALKNAILELLYYLKHDFTEEGIFLVENLLLKPTVKIQNKSLGIGCMQIGNTFLVADNDIQTSELDSNTFITGCEDGCDEDAYDPYSYRVSIVLPGYSYRFSDPDFRKYAEEVIRQELPAHVLAKICWVGDRGSDTATAKSNLENFEERYKAFLEYKSTGTSKDPNLDDIKELITSMDQLYNIYPPGRLLDCSQEDSDDLDGKIILGQSNI
ncbi:hypothetical protein ABW636_00440 [Aquimarina sp. 2201CG1-2-11]|uniref:hypothetical protein n=1 Tax=Aquimarina discodermiae TaxID=3231043 RepID=UPI0034624D0A